MATTAIHPGQTVTVTVQDTLDRTMTITGTVERFDRNRITLNIGRGATWTGPIEMIRGET